MEFHPSKIPIVKTYDIKEEYEATEAADDMVKLGFANQKSGFKVLMPKEKKVAKRIGYTVTTTVNYGLRQTNQERDIRYWTFHHDDEHYAIVLISNSALTDLGF